MSKKQDGFTLVELVAVIVILGVLATATTQYIIFGSQVYIESTERQRVLSQSRFLVERLTRELKTAIPNSVRVSGNCIEFVPIKTSGAYRTDSAATLAPIAPNPLASTIDVVSWDVQNSAENDRLYIYAINRGQIYDQTYDTDDRWGRILSVAVAPSGSAPEYTVTFKAQISDNSASNERFPEESPISRFYTADHSVNYCLANGSVFRFIETNFSPVQSIVIPNTAVLMAEGLTNASAPFNYSTASQQRNSVVTLYLEFSANAGENMFFNHEVHIPNVP